MVEHKGLDLVRGGLQNLLNNLYASISQVNLDFSQFMSSITDSLAAILRSLPGRIGDVVSTSYSIGAGVASFIISCILAIYFLADKERIKKGLKRLLKALISEPRYRSTADFYRRCNEILLRYIGGDLLDGLVVGVVNWLFMTIMRMPYGVLISVIVGVTNLAPTFGPIIGAAIGSLILLMINPWYALWFLIFTIVLQTIDGYIIKPKLFGSALGVSSVSILIFLAILLDHLRHRLTAWIMHRENLRRLMQSGPAPGPMAESRKAPGEPAGEGPQRPMESGTQ